MTDKLKEAIEWLKEIRDLFMPKTRNAIDTVVAEVETKTYTAEEREKYGKYCAEIAFDDGFNLGFIDCQRPSFEQWWSEFQKKEETK